MASFLEKLKKGMGLGITDSEWSEVEPKPHKKRKGLKKVEIKSEPIVEKKDLPSKNYEESGLKKDKLFEQEGQLAVDVYETKDELVVQSAIAGVKPEDLDITIENDRLIIRGERSEQTSEEQKNYFHQECYWGAFSREIILPLETDPSRADASMKQGVLTIRLPKIEREKKRKIQVKG